MLRSHMAQGPPSPKFHRRPRSVKDNSPWYVMCLSTSRQVSHPDCRTGTGSVFSFNTGIYQEVRRRLNSILSHATSFWLLPFSIFRDAGGDDPLPRAPYTWISSSFRVHRSLISHHYFCATVAVLSQFPTFSRG